MGLGGDRLLVGFLLGELGIDGRFIPGAGLALILLLVLVAPSQGNRSGRRGATSELDLLLRFGVR